jgi:hypothetical protein
LNCPLFKKSLTDITVKQKVNHKGYWFGILE